MIRKIQNLYNKMLLFSMNYLMHTKLYEYVYASKDCLRNKSEPDMVARACDRSILGGQAGGSWGQEFETSPDQHEEILFLLKIQN